MLILVMIMLVINYYVCNGNGAGPSEAYFHCSGLPDAIGAGMHGTTQPRPSGDV